MLAHQAPSPATQKARRAGISARNRARAEKAMRLQGLERSGAVGERVKPGAHPKLTKPMPTRADEHVRSPLTTRHGSRRAVCVCTRTHVTVASGGPSPHPGTCGAHCARWGARQPDVPGGLHQRGEALVGQRLPAVGRTRARHILPAASSEQPAAPQDVLAPRAVWLHRSTTLPSATRRSKNFFRP